MSSTPDTKEYSQERGRAWTWTLSNYTQTEVEHLKSDIHGVDYMVFGYETAPTTGTPHLQGFTYFDRKRVLKTVKKTLNERMHFEESRGTAYENRDYCLKEKGNYFEKGTCPDTLGGQKGKQLEQDRWKKIRMLAEKGNFEEIDDKSYIQNHMAIMHMWKPPPAPAYTAKKKGLWLWGDADSGKSRYARTGLGTYTMYRVDQQFQMRYKPGSTLLLEDIMPEMKNIVYKLKIVCDGYPFIWEEKNITPYEVNPPRVVVTANHPPSHFCQYQKDTDALHARFQVVFLDDAELNQTPLAPQ